MSAQDEVVRRLSILARETVDWEAVFREEPPRVYNFFRYRLSDGTQAEDLTSATFEKAWAGRKRYRHDRASFSTWLFAIDDFRRRRHTFSLEEVEIETDSPGVEEQVQTRQVLDQIGTMLRRLPDRDQELVALKYGADLTNREIARLTGLSETNVGSILNRTVNTQSYDMGIHAQSGAYRLRRITHGVCELAQK
ncbi:MAG: sigma-70 family RNA polymerase sigma factor [Chloroflexota bacterium]|nr:MAG: sigma-70 family RNA polymerase sigma factor [Chloroflexota bacterium]